jgi:hypothetical protein
MKRTMSLIDSLSEDDFVAVDEDPDLDDYLPSALTPYPLTESNERTTFDNEGNWAHQQLNPAPTPWPPGLVIDLALDIM